MIPLLIIGGIALLLAALLALPVHLTIAYREEVTVRLRILFISVTLLPPKPKTPEAARRAAEKKRKKSEKKAERVRKKKKKKKAAPAKSTPPPQPKKPRSFSENIVLVRGIVAALFRKTGKHLHLKMARIHLRVATGDAATTALLYGTVSASLAYLLAALDRITDLRAEPEDVMVIADYLAEKPSADIKLIFTLRLWGALSTAISAVFALLKAKGNPKKRKSKTTQPQGNL